MNRLRRLVTSAWLALAAAAAWAPAYAARLDAAQAMEAPAEGYDALLQLPATGPDQKLVLDWGARGGIVVRFTASATEAVLVEGANQRVLGSGRPASPGEIRVRRRLPMLEVSQRGEVLLRTWCNRPLGGEVGPDAAAKLSDLEVVEAQEPDFNYEFSDLEGTGTSWSPLQGNWKVAVYRDPLIQRDHGDTGPIGASWYEVERPAAAISVCGSEAWDRYRARCVVEPVPGLRSGLLFYLADIHNFAALTVTATSATEGLAELSVVRAGRSIPLQRKTVAWRTGNWHELAVEALDDHAWAQVDGDALPATELPFFTCGRVGLYADGGPAARFDDVTVTSLRRSVDDFGRAQGIEPRELGDGWQTAGGLWSLQAGAVRGKSSGLALCERVGAGWPGSAVSATVNPKSGSAGVYLHRTGGGGYAFLVGLGKYVLGVLRNSAVEPLKTGDLQATGPVPLRLSWESGTLEAVAGSQRVVCHDFTATSGACGLLVQGEAEFSGFRADEVSDPTVIISTVSGRPEWVCTEDTTYQPLLGYTWQPRNGRWSPPGVRLDRPADWLGGYWGGEAGRTAAVGDVPPLTPVGYGRPAELWYAHECPGDAFLRASGCKLPPNSCVGVIIAAQEGSAATGYAAELTTNADRAVLRLFRQSEIVAEKAVAQAASYDLALWRDGDTILARCGDVTLTYDDPAPLTGARCLVYARGTPTIAALSLGHRRARIYPFQRVEADWQPEQGEWRIHSGMACIAWNHWLTGRGTPRAFSYHIRPHPADLHVDFSVSEYTEGYEDGEHRHFPYHDISLLTCASNKDPDSGYRFLIGKDGYTTQLLRLGQVVAQTTDPRFRIAAPGGGNRLRALHVVADQRRGLLRLTINGALALEYRDPQPLPGGLVGIGVDNCTANFRDLWIAHLDDPY